MPATNSSFHRLHHVAPPSISAPLKNMATNKSIVISVVLTIFSLALIAVACYAHYIIQRFALPIPTALSSLVIVLPVAQALGSWYLTRPRGSHHLLALPISSPITSRTYDGSTASSQSKARLHARLATLLLYSLAISTTVLVTLSGTHLGPANSLNCALQEQWLSLFRTKNAKQIRTIQDALQCCGFRSVYDMAWPFPRAEGGKTQRSTCAKTYERADACFASWRKEEQKVAGLLIVVCVGSWACQVIAVNCVFTRPSWLQGFGSRYSGYQPGGNNAEHLDGAERATHAIEYTDDQSEGTNEVEEGRANEGGRRVASPSPLEHHALFPSAQGNGHSGNEWAIGRQ